MLTISRKFEEIVHQHNSKTALAFLAKKEYHKISYLELNNQRLSKAQAWQQAGWQQGEKLAVMLPNCPEWIVSDLAAATLGLIVVPIHTTFNHEYLQKVIVHSESDYLIIHSDCFLKFQALLETLSLKKILIVGEKIVNDKIDLWHWSEIVTSDKKNWTAPTVVEDDIHTIIYTSGTTGDPKGVMLSHKNLVSDILSAKRNLEILASDRFFSFLPLSHAFERTGGYYGAIFSGSSIYFAQNIKTIVEDIKLAQPTILPSVPRIFEKVYEKIFDKIRSAKPLQKKLFYRAMNLAKLRKQKHLSFLQKCQYPILNKLVLDKVRQSLGGRLRMAISGGASLNPTIAKFFENLGIKIIEGYGLTETSPIIAVNQWEKYKFGTVGIVIDCNEIKIAPDKEILVRGDNVTKGYYKNSAASESLIDADGWLHTGDLGFVDAEGFLTIIGRAKDVIVLSTGKNIFPEPIENILNVNQYINQAMVYGDNKKVLHAFIVPDLTALQKWCLENHYNYRFPEILNRPEVIDFYRDLLGKILDNLSEVEKIKEFKLIGEEFSQENGFLTPSLKLRRAKILEKYL